MSEGAFTTRAINDDVLEIVPGKSLDNNNAHEMVATINSALERGYKNILLDMSELEFLSSAGVGSILGTVETAREAGGDIILYNISSTVLHVLEVLDLELILADLEVTQRRLDKVRSAAKAKPETRKARAHTAIRIRFIVGLLNPWNND